MNGLVPEWFLADYQKQQKQLIIDLSRLIIIGLSSELVEDCPNCIGDSITNLSAGIYTPFSGTVTVFSGTLYEKQLVTKTFKNKCPICRGQGVLSAPNEIQIPCHVQWGPTSAGVLLPTPPGIASQHAVRLKTDSVYYDVMQQAKYFIVDGVKVLPTVPARNRGMGTIDGIVEILAATEGHVKEAGHL